MELEIEGLIDEGWKPRIKTRKNRKYITLRKGNKEKSLGKYTDELWEKVKPVEPWATPAQMSKLEKRLDKVEENQSGANPSLDTLIMKRIKQLEEGQRTSSEALGKLHLKFEKIKKEPFKSAERKLKKSISSIEENHRVDMRIINSSITDFKKMREELIESAKRRLTDDDACKEINKNGFCLLYYFSYDEYERFEYLLPRGTGEREGKKIYYANVKKHPLICSACPDYERKG